MRAENPHSCLEYYHYRGYNIEVKKDVGSSNECQSLCEKMERCKYYTCTVFAHVKCLLFCKMYQVGQECRESRRQGRFRYSG